MLIDRHDQRSPKGVGTPMEPLTTLSQEDNDGY